MGQKSADIVNLSTEKTYEPLLLSTKEHYDIYWAYAEPHIQRCLDETTHGEIDAHHIYQRGLAAENYVIVVKSDEGDEPEVRLVLVFEPRVYPNLAALNLLVLGGTDLKMLQQQYWDKLLGWAYMNGVRSIECSISNPAMERIISRLKFKPVYTQMRLDLTEAQNDAD